MTQRSQVKRTMRTGATKKEVRPKLNRAIPVRVMLFVLCFALLGVAVSQGNIGESVVNIANHLHKPVKSVAIEGDFKFSDKKLIKDIIREELSHDFVNVNLDRLKNRIEDDAWIRSVNVQRKWPDSLLVKIIEEKPIARWGGRGILNHQGELIDVAENDFLVSLPLLSGPEGTGDELANWYLKWKEIFADENLSIKSIAVNNKGDWKFIIHNDLELLLGRENKQELLERFLSIYQVDLKNKINQISKIDLRYDNALAVSWREVEQNWAIADDAI